MFHSPSALVTASEAFRPSAITFQPPLQHVDAASASQAGSGGGSSQSTVATLKELLHTHSTTCALRRQFVIGMRDLVALQCGITTSDAVEDETETAAAHPPSRAQSKSKSVRARFAACCQPKRWLKWISEFAGHGSDAVAFVSRGCVSQAIERSAVTIAVLRSALPSVSHATASDARSIDTLLRYPIAFRTRDHAGNVPSAAKTSARGSTRNPKRKSDKRSTESKDDEESSVPFAADPRDAELAELDDLRSAVIRLYFRLRSGLARLVLCQQRNYSPALRLLLASAVEQSRASQSESDATARAHIATPAPGTGSASSTSVEQDESKVEADANAAIQQLFDNRMREMKTELFGQLHRDSSYVRAAISESISLWKHFHGVISRLSQVCLSIPASPFNS